MGAGAPGEVEVVGMDDELRLDTVEVGEGESLEDIKAKLNRNRQFQLKCWILQTLMMIR